MNILCDSMFIFFFVTKNFAYYNVNFCLISFIHDIISYPNINITAAIIICIIMQKVRLDTFEIEKRVQNIPKLC